MVVGVDASCKDAGGVKGRRSAGRRSQRIERGPRPLGATAEVSATSSQSSAAQGRVVEVVEALPEESSSVPQGRPRPSHRVSCLGRVSLMCVAT